MRARRSGAGAYTLHGGRRVCRRLPLPGDARRVDAHDCRRGLRRGALPAQHLAGFEVDRTPALPSAFEAGGAAAPHGAPESSGARLVLHAEITGARRLAGPQRGEFCGRSVLAVRSYRTWASSAFGCCRIRRCIFLPWRASAWRSWSRWRFRCRMQPGAVRLGGAAAEDFHSSCHAGILLLRPSATVL